MVPNFDDEPPISHDLSLGIAANVLSGTSRPVIRIAVEGKIGSGKTILLAMIKEMLEGKVEIYVENEYTNNELELERGTDRTTTLAMYSPVVLLCDRLNPDV